MGAVSGTGAFRSRAVRRGPRATAVEAQQSAGCGTLTVSPSDQGGDGGDGGNGGDGGGDGGGQNLLLVGGVVAVLAIAYLVSQGGT